MMKGLHLILLLILTLCSAANAQNFTLADTLRGTLSSLRSSFDVHYYELDIAIDLEQRSISGVNAIYFNVLSPFDSLQLDLFENLVIDSIVYQGRVLQFSRLHQALFVRFSATVRQGTRDKMEVYYHGIPIVAKSAPWDGGFVWKKDANGKHHVGVACEGSGASAWWPNKDHLSDEPDSMKMHFTAPSDLMCVGNGKMIASKTLGEVTRWSWAVSNPINNYNVTLNIGDYVHFKDYYHVANDSLALNYYVLRDNLEKAKAHFKQVPPMLAIFEHAFGRYPFWGDGYALIETSYAGMEHQSAIAYGNKYMKGYLGRYPSTMDFDYIIVHETGHEWWGNSVSINDLADMWVHESFCTYAESVFVEATYGYDKMLEYLMYQKNFITNKSPIRGDFGVNHEGNATDMYYKGSWMLHTLRSVVNDDAQFKAMLKAIAIEFRHKNVDGAEVIAFISQTLGTDMATFFEQYIGYAQLPQLEYRLKGRKLSMRWNANVRGFSMPMEVVLFGDVVMRVNVTQDDWVTVQLPKSDAGGIRFRENRFLFALMEAKTKSK